MLFEQHAEFLSAAVEMFFRRVGALDLFAHVIDFQRENAQAVDGPRRTLGVDGCIGQHLNAVVALQEIAVDLFHEVGALLVRAVDAALQQQCLDGVDVRVADDVFEMPLHRVDPAFQVEFVLDRVALERVVNVGIDVVGQMVIIDDANENIIAFFSECCHNFFQFFSSNVHIFGKNNHLF